MSEAGAATLEVEARCKVNLGLAVMARRGDGYHQVETVMARLALADSVELRLAPARPGPAAVTLRIAAEPAPAYPSGSVGEATHPSEEAAAELRTALGTLPTDADNLVLRAARAYLQAWSAVAASAAPGVSATLVKRVPIAAGLGGGSADAAATLRGLARLLPGDVDLMALATTLGSDVPFFVADWPAALARGRGERLAPLAVPEAHVVLAKPPLAVSAGEAYAALVGFTPRLRHEQALAALAAGREPGWKNALQNGVMKAYPIVREVLGLLREAGLRGCLMSGSGPTCFGVAADIVEAARVAEELRAARPELWVTATRLS